MIGPLKNLLGGKKEDGKQGKYFVEFDDAEGNSAEAAEGATPAEAAPEPVSEDAKAEKKKPAAKKAAKKVAKKKAKKKDAKKKVDKRAKPEAEVVVEEPVAPPAPPQPAVLFAPENLMPTPNGNRRRPGPSLDMFKDMAQGMGRR
ncbi:MAG: hypothetical protein AAF889_04780 [Cyanobacteria bacterium P01_D01_bin.73]